MLSVIIATHNRADLLLRNLAALSQEAQAQPQFEVWVVADDCQDGTRDAVMRFAQQAPYPLQLLSHAVRNAAATRNQGAEHATGRHFLFLDDDVIPQPGFIEAHRNAQHPHRVVFGYSKPVYPFPASFWQKNARLWWEDMYGKMRSPGHRFGYRDFFSGNVSMPAELFRRIGGFDPRIGGRLEDYEIGMRLLSAGARFHFARDALAYHYDETDLPEWLRRSRMEGAADVQIVRRHPQLMAERFPRSSERESWRSMRRLARQSAIFGGRLTDGLAGLMLNAAKISERLKVRKLWWLATGLLREYHYWRGVTSELGSREAVEEWVSNSPAPPKASRSAPAVDLAEAIDPAILRSALDQAEQKGLKVVWRGREVFQVPPQPGKERLREDHLREMLREKAAERFLPALAIDLIQTGRERGLLW